MTRMPDYAREVRPLPLLETLRAAGVPAALEAGTLTLSRVLARRGII